MSPSNLLLAPLVEAAGIAPRAFECKAYAPYVSATDPAVLRGEVRWHHRGYEPLPAAVVAWPAEVGDDIGWSAVAVVGEQPLVTGALELLAPGAAERLRAEALDIITPEGAKRVGQAAVIKQAEAPSEPAQPPASEPEPVDNSAITDADAAELREELPPDVLKELDL